MYSDYDDDEFFLLTPYIDPMFILLCNIVTATLYW